MASDAAFAAPVADVPPRSPRLLRRSFVALAGALLSLALLGLALRQADLTAVRDALNDAHSGHVVLAVGMLGVMYLLQARRWATLLALNVDRPPRPRAVLAWVLGGVALNNVAPGRAGDIARVHWAARGTRLGHSRSLATVVADRTADVFVLGVALGIGLFASGPGGWPVAVGGSAIVFVAAIVMFALAIRFGFVRMGRSTQFGPWLSTRLGTFLVRSGDALLACLSPRVAVRALALSFAAWSAWAVAAFAIARALGLDLSPAELALLAGAVNLGVALPSSPGFVGTYQWLCVTTLALAGVDASPALAFSILLHAAWFIPTTLAGIALILAKASFARSPWQLWRVEDAA